MLVNILKSKIHRAKVVDKNIAYEGSITIYEELLKQANISEYEQVHVVNVNNGQRFVTYAIKGTKQGEITLNGAAARCAEAGDVIIIMTYGMIDESELNGYAPLKVLLGEANEIVKISK
ncbi:MAG: aspartate 1-decarboxylase [Candidatus Margulisbacteria bacterium]|nr:aspartate 1-decarboxylase [Candidatus Margulisiibacteriota bacterium]